MKKAQREARLKRAINLLASCTLFIDGPVGGLMRVCATRTRRGTTVRGGAYAYLNIDDPRPSDQQMRALVKASIIKGRMLEPGECTRILLAQALEA